MVIIFVVAVQGGLPRPLALARGGVVLVLVEMFKAHLVMIQRKSANPMPDSSREVCKVVGIRIRA